MAKTRYEWIAALDGLSPSVARLNLRRTVADEPYWNTATNTCVHKDAFNLSECADHCRAIAKWIDALAAKGVEAPTLRKLLTDLTSGRNTYGAFSELAAYGQLSEHNIPYVIQVPASGRDILNPNGSDLDGQLELNGLVLFDVKAFGLQEHLVELLSERLNKELAPDFVAATGSWDIPVDEVQSLLGVGYASLRAELVANRFARRGVLKFEVRAPNRVQISEREFSPFQLAEESAGYAFNFAKQFARRKPFLLIFVLHPWLGGQTLSVNFAGYADTFTRAFSRRTFMQFLRDKTNKHFGITRASASKLLSGLLFVDAWQGTDPPRQSARLFLNPHAKHPISQLDARLLAAHIPHLAVEDFRHDTY